MRQLMTDESTARSLVKKALTGENFQKYGIIFSTKKIVVEKESIQFLGSILNQLGLKLQLIIFKIREFPTNYRTLKLLTCIRVCGL